MDDQWYRRGLFFVVCGLALLVYVLTLPPTVTLTQASMFAVAADHLGVGKHPGYPVWSLTAHLFVNIFGFFTYRGFPNPARAVALLSSIWGALSCGLLSLLIYNSSRNGAKRGQVLWVYAVPAFSASLLFGFSPTMWRHTVNAETHSLTMLFFIGTWLAFQQWMHVKGAKGLWLIALLMGFNLAVSPFLIVLFPVFLVLCMMKSRKDSLSRMAAHIVCVPVVMAIALVVPYTLLVVFGSDDVPMMADLSRWQGIRHMLIRGQYEAVTILGHWHPVWLYKLYGQWARIGIREYTLPIALLGIVPILFVCRMAQRQRVWMGLLLLMLIISFFIVIYVAFPRLDVQTTMAMKPLMLPTLAIMAIFIGWGMSLLLVKTLDINRDR